MDKASQSADRWVGCSSIGAHQVLNEEAFSRMIAIERKRTERSGVPFLLMLLEAGKVHGLEKNERALNNILSILPLSIRDTDIIGWYKDRAIVGVIFTGLVCTDKNSILSVILSKVGTTLRSRLTSDQFDQVSISFHFFPDAWDHDNRAHPSNPTLYPDLSSPGKDNRSLLRVKQVIDILGSTILLILCAPLFLAIALAVKMSSKGPAFFRQQRVGQFGRSFTFLKFRSMYTDNDPGVHKEYTTQLIAGKITHDSSNGNSKAIYKLTNDKRITKIGKLLRRTSLDELPQLFNVLKGDMSLVGPRPPMPYELAAYRTWHRRRVLEVKPGITGLWQVIGRSRVDFDEMVRLDLRYATSWTLSLDLKILASTPRAVIGGNGAC
jgi:lipopolysaccharide/colanic/teichoic acid biosynthesis glycosyltransferase